MAYLKCGQLEFSKALYFTGPLHGEMIRDRSGAVRPI